ncbi:MAG: NAD(P)/FAD-dependent oxidoreductase [Variibacter sp.]
MAEPFPLEPALWTATAPPAPATPPLSESTSCDVCVIGGGYAGLSTALHLAERGISVVVLEAKEVGYGGSGRNGGQVIPGLKYDPDELEKKFGPECGARLVQFAGSTADAVFQLIIKHRMEVPHLRSGWIQAAHAPTSIAELRGRAEQWACRGAPVEFLDKAETDRHLGTSQYFASWIDRRAGAVQPLAFARGLARAALAAGARVHGATPATGLFREQGKWVVETAARTSVRADRVVMCTNAYTGALWSGVRETVIAPNTYQIATEPLSDNIRKSILPFGQVVSDARKVLLYFRLDHHGRLLLGGRGPFREPKEATDWAHLESVLERLFPQTKGVKIEHRWCGRIAITRDFLPHLHEPAPGLLVDIGCMGRGVALQTALGRSFADYIASGDENALPFLRLPIKPIPFHGLNRMYFAAAVAWYRHLDRKAARTGTLRET